MNFLTTLQADRLIAQIREEADPSSANGKQLFAKLGKLGASAIPKILEALASADKRQTTEYVEILSSLVSDKTLPLITRGLADGDPRTTAGTAWALSSSKRFNINRLVDLLGEDEYSKAGLVEVLQAHKDRLNVRQLLGQIYHLQPSEKAAVFKLIDEVTTEEMVPDLLTRMDGKDPLVKTHLINVLARFDLPAVNKALQEALRDGNKLVRGAALQGIARSKTAVDVALISKLLLDPDLDVMNKAVDVIIQLNHPETAKYLIEALKAENEFSRRSAVEILNAIGTTHSVKYLLEAVSDEDWWVRSRASDALARIGGPRVVDAVLELIKDKDENIRRSAIEILNTCRDKRAVDKLIEATRDKDWWVSERAADALAEIGDAKALPALLEMMAKNNRSLPVAIAAVGKLGNSNVLNKVLPYLQRPEKEVRVAAIGAVAQLAGEQQAEAVRGPLQQSAQGADETVQRAVTKALQKLDGRLSPSGRFTGTATFAGPGPTATATPPSMPAPQARTSQTRITPAPSPAATSTARRRARGRGCRAAAARCAVVRSERTSERRHDRGALQVHSEDRQRRLRHRRPRRGHRRRGAFDPQVPECQRLVRRRDVEAVRSRVALLTAYHAQERHSHLRLPVRRRQLRDLDGVLPFAHARRRDRQREADAAEEGPRLRHRHLRRHERRASTGHHPSRLEAGEYPDQRLGTVEDRGLRRRGRSEERRHPAHEDGLRDRLAEIHGARANPR